MKKIYADRITREEINEAMKQFFARGGKITKIDTPQKAVSHSLMGDSFDLHDNLVGEDFSYLEVNSGFSPLAI